jgi:ribosomal protein S6--L-glutamate ligase
MILSFHPCFVADAQIIPGDRKLDTTDFTLIERAEAILLPQGCSSALYRACRRSSAALFPHYEWRFRYPGKTGQSRFFERMGWPHPVTKRWRSAEALRAKREKLPREMPFFIKADKAHEGAGVWLIRDPEDLERVLDMLKEWGHQPFLTQEMIPCEGDVLRVVVVGKSLCCYWKRPKQPGRAITTVSRGSRIDKRWRSDLREKGISQAKRICDVSGINLAAMDFVFSMTDPDPQPLLLEINYYFGRRGLGGSLRYYRSLHRVIRDWLEEKGLDPKRVKLV